MKITGWTNWNDPNCRRLYPIPPGAVELVVSELRKNGYKFSGEYHQNGEFGVPVFDGHAMFQCSMRMWGNLMAHAYPDGGVDSMSYCRWAWDAPEDEVYPNNKHYSHLKEK